MPFTEKIMIITFSYDINTKKASEIIASEHKQSVLDYFGLPTDMVCDPSDNTLILLDLSADGKTQSSIEPWLIVEDLYTNNLLRHITSIQIIMSDVSPSMPITGFAWEICKKIIEISPDSQISVSFSSNPDDSPTLIEPPNSADGEWTIYSIPESIVKSPQTVTGLKQFGIYKTNATTMILEKDIHKRLEDIEHTIQPDTIRATYAN